MPHLDEGTLTALLDDELAAQERQQAEQHLATCGDCRQLLDEVRGFAGEADQLIESVQPAPRTERRPGVAAGPRWDRLRPFAWAATLVIAAGLGWSASARRFSDLAPAAAGLADQKTPATPEAVTPPAADEAARPLEETRERVAPRQDEAPRRQAAEAPAPATTDMAKSAAAPAAAESDVTANAVQRTEASVRGNPPAAALAAEPRQAEVGGARDVARRTHLYRVASLEEAVQILGGTVKLIDGLSPTRVGLRAPQQPGDDPSLEVVRITYLDPPGRELWLDQQRSPVPNEGPAAAAAAGGIISGDTLVTAAGDGLTRVRWITADGFRLTLTGYLPGDSLRILVRRVH